MSCLCVLFICRNINVFFYISADYIEILCERKIISKTQDCHYSLLFLRPPDTKSLVEAQIWSNLQKELYYDSSLWVRRGSRLKLKLSNSFLPRVWILLPFIRELISWFRGFPKQLVLTQVVWKLLASVRSLQDCPRHGTDRKNSTRMEWHTLNWFGHFVSSSKYRSPVLFLHLLIFLPSCYVTCKLLKSHLDATQWILIKSYFVDGQWILDVRRN